MKEVEEYDSSLEEEKEQEDDINIMKESKGNRNRGRDQNGSSKHDLHLHGPLAQMIMTPNKNDYQEEEDKLSLTCDEEDLDENVQ